MNPPNRIELLQADTDPLKALKTLLHFEPLSLCVREIMRIKALSQFRFLETPLLDVGCGDGLFWEAVCRSIRRHDQGHLSGLFGIDIDDRELNLASMRIGPLGGELSRLDITTDRHATKPEMHALYPTIIANCSLEHVKEIDKALRNILTFLHDKGTFFLFVPSPFWTDTMAAKRFLARVDLRVAGMYGAIFDGFFQHHHLYPHFIWRDILTAAGYEVTCMQGIGAEHGNRIFNHWLFPSIPAFLYKSIFKKYPVMYTGFKEWYLKLMEPGFIKEVQTGSFIREDVGDPEVVEYFIVCRKKDESRAVLSSAGKE
jgi:SAM-dependent methyltransferase